MLDFTRRDVVQGASALVAFAALSSARLASAFPSRPGETVVPWLDQPPLPADPFCCQTLLTWEDLDSWITPNEKFFSIAHFDRPVIEIMAGDGRVPHCLLLEVFTDEGIGTMVVPS